MMTTRAEPSRRREDLTWSLHLEAPVLPPSVDHSEDAGSLLAWAQMTCLDGELKKAEPKTLRNRILHVAAVLVRHGRRLVLRLDETWPWAPALQRAFIKLRSTFP